MSSQTFAFSFRYMARQHEKASILELSSRVRFIICRHSLVPTLLRVKIMGANSGNTLVISVAVSVFTWRIGYRIPDTGYRIQNTGSGYE
jgi:hypothetical protein